MRTHIVLDDDLIRAAFCLSRARTKKDLVHDALRELVRVRSRKSLLLRVRGRIRLTNYP